MGEALGLCSGSRVRCGGEKQGELICLFHNDSDCTGSIKKTFLRAEPRENTTWERSWPQACRGPSVSLRYTCLWGGLKLFFPICFPPQVYSSEVDKIISNIMQKSVEDKFYFFDCIETEVRQENIRTLRECLQQPCSFSSTSRSEARL